MRRRSSDRSNSIESLLGELRSLGIRDERVLEAIRVVPREKFVTERFHDRAWENHALPLAYGQTISQPYVVAVMSEALQLNGSERLLEIGTGSGYQAAILSQLAGEVVSIERIEPLARQAAALLEQLGYRNVTVVTADGSEGFAKDTPWDGIIVTAGAPAIPESLLAQLRESGGRLVIPVGPGGEQRLTVVERQGDVFLEHDLGPVAFVPLVGRGGWPEI